MQIKFSILLLSHSTHWIRQHHFHLLATVQVWSPYDYCASLRIERSWLQALAWDIVLCSWARHCTLTVPLSTRNHCQMKNAQKLDIMAVITTEHVFSTPVSLLILGNGKYNFGQTKNVGVGVGKDKVRRY